MGLLLTQQTGDKVVYRGGIQRHARDNWIKARLEPGNYSIFVNFLIKFKVKGYPKTEGSDIGVSVFGPSVVALRKAYENDILKKIEIVLSKAFSSKSMQIDEDWGHMREDRQDILYKVTTFYVPSSSDGYGFKVYQNQSNKNVVIQFKGNIEGGRMSKYFILIF